MTIRLRLILSGVAVFDDTTAKVLAGAWAISLCFIETGFELLEVPP